MDPQRRNFIKQAGLFSLAGLLPWNAGCDQAEIHTEAAAEVKPPQKDSDWQEIRSHFDLDPEYIHMSCLLLASHPEPVQKKIEEYRKKLDRNPALVQQSYSKTQYQIRETAAKYMDVEAKDIGLTDSTTMGTGLLINGLKIRPEQEMLAAKLDYYSTRKSIQYKAGRTGASYRLLDIYSDTPKITAEAIVERLTREIRPNTRLICGTWVHSSTGLKIPVQQIAARIKEINEDRDEEDRLIFFLDGVHGFGVEDTSVAELGCDLFTAGTHKWMFGPRGTGLIWARPEIQSQVTPTIPTFTNTSGWGGEMTPGGFKPFEHQWSMIPAFEYHQSLGRVRIQDRISELSSHLKEGLRKMEHVTLYTPMDPALSAGIVCFDVNGKAPDVVVRELAGNNIISSITPYETTHARLAPGIYNSHDEVDRVLREIKKLA